MLNEKTFFQKALHSYDNPQCVTIEEFQEDLNRFSHIKKLITKYIEGAELNERLLLNHLVILFNVFGDNALEFLLFKVDKQFWGILVPFIVLLNRLPDEFFSNNDSIELDNNVIEKLRRI